VRAVAPPRPALTSFRFRLFATIGVLLGIGAAFVAGEIAVRKQKPRPPVQVVRKNNVRLADGVPVWEWSTDPDREPRACAEAHPERIRVMFLGSSITHGFTIPVRDTFTVALEERLNALRPDPGFCVMNFAQPGFTSQQKLATGTVEIPRYRPAVVLWEGWNEFGDFVLLGHDAYELRRYLRRDDGFPGLFGVPDSLNRFLFLHSKLYEYLTLKFGEQDPKADEMKAAKERLERLLALTDSVGARLGIYLCPRLDRTFRESVESPMLNNLAAEFAETHHVPHYWLAQELIDQDYLVLRIDDCCHFSSEGHRALVPIFEKIVLEVLDGKAPAH
jgi:hypothetical protein